MYSRTTFIASFQWHFLISLIHCTCLHVHVKKTSSTQVRYFTFEVQCSTLKAVKETLKNTIHVHVVFGFISTNVLVSVQEALCKM